MGYTYRNAAEEFFAASAPAGFYGNSFSTFAKGVAMLRAPPAPNGSSSPPPAFASFAFDCAPHESPGWFDRTVSFTLAHPGFELLQGLDEANCRKQLGQTSYYSYAPGQSRADTSGARRYARALRASASKRGRRAAPAGRAVSS